MMFYRGQFVVAMLLALAATARAQAPAPMGTEVAAPVSTVSSQATPAAVADSSPLVPADVAGATGPSDQENALEHKGIGGHSLGAGTIVGAAGANSRPSSGGSLWWQTLGALLLVIGLILAMRWILRRTSSLRAVAGGGQVIEVLSRTNISARQSLLLVRVGQRILVIGAGETLTTLVQFDDPAQVAELLGNVEQARASSLSNTFARALSQWRSSSVDVAVQQEATASVQSSDAAAPFGQSADPRTPAGGAADRLRNMAQKVRDVGSSLRRRP
jgi:flagellar biogenesis protein FliO